MLRSTLLSLLALCGCKTVEGPAGQGGAGFRAVSQEAPAVPMEAMFGICWSPAAGAQERVKLMPQPGGDVLFEAKNGASNGVGWCLREIVTSYPVAARPTAELEVAPPSKPVDLWAALAWVKLLAPSRFGPERGLLDPAPLAAACLARGTVNEGTIAIEHSPTLVVRGLTSLEHERCLEAVLAATAWPAPKDVRLSLSRPARGIEPSGDVSHYFSPEGAALGVLDAQTVKEAMRSLSPKVGACWNEALVRRAGLGGARTFRLRTDPSGVLVAAWVSTGLTDGPAAADAILDRCLAQALTGLRFPGTSGDGAYTWVFATR
ncbi:MAG: hypothetical protein JNJ54_26515 [Myxococcaceae bacterium]|nr:hypothetical protein [Myxococcaceae bacterium]